MSLKRIRLELARTPAHPDVSRLHGYELMAPLDDTGHLASAEWPKRKGPARCAASGTARPTSTAH